jgi:uncharacterized phage protein (TIGR01671 family)
MREPMLAFIWQVWGYKMRELKFRAYCQGQMWTVTDLNWTDNSIKLDIGLLNGYLEGLRDWLKNVDLMQYTGLNDKNQKEIYEGDIVQTPNKQQKFVVEISDYMQLGFIQQTQGLLEVIGNIYENPDLLETK